MNNGIIYKTNDALYAPQLNDTVDLVNGPYFLLGNSKPVDMPFDLSLNYNPLSRATAIARDSNGNVIQPVIYVENGIVYVAHIFTTNGTIQFLRSINVEYLVVGGGGGGGSSTGGCAGGGGGGVLKYVSNEEDNTSNSPLFLNGGIYSVLVGAGGSGGVTTAGGIRRGASGGASSIGSFLLITGGGGGGGVGAIDGANGGLGGGSGGGGSGTASVVAGSGGLAGSIGLANNGGNGILRAITGYVDAGGGGGAKQVGSNAVVGAAGKGGDGVGSKISGTYTYYAGGGGGGFDARDANPPAAAGGLGGGGSGGVRSGNGNPGSANTGGGGGGCSAGISGRPGGNGGSGIVIIRYRKNEPTVVNFPSIDYDSDALAYITAVQQADGTDLEFFVAQAINNFIVNCKRFNLWSSIQASCILMGAHTLSGALTPLVGTAPTNNGPFVSGDYNRKTGLKGDGTTKYLDTNRAGNADAQNSIHISTLITETHTLAASATFIGNGISTDTGPTRLIVTTRGSAPTFSRSMAAGMQDAGASQFGSNPATTGFVAASRNSSGAFSRRANGATGTSSTTSQTPEPRNFYVFAANSSTGATSYNEARMCFYSIGSSVGAAANLALLDTLVSTLYSDIGASIQ